MVDSEDVDAPCGSLASIAEDNEYFKRMCGLVPLDGTTDIGSDDDQDKHKVETEVKKHARKDRKKEKLWGKKLSGKKEILAVPSKKQNRGEDVQLTEATPKRQKVSNSGEETSPFENHRLSPESSNVEVHIKHSNSSKLPGKSFAKRKESQHEPGDKNNSSSLSSDSKQTFKTTSTVSGEQPTAQTLSADTLTSELSDTDRLVVASIHSIEDKREKLRAKIAELQAKRNYTNREKFEKKKLKRQESKMKLKQKRKLEKLQKKQNGDSSNPSQGNLNKEAVTPTKPVYNTEGQMVFSKFDFTNSAKKEKKQNEYHGKDYKRLMEKIEKRNEKINKVKSKDVTAGKALEEKFKWESVMHKAEGEKVKDNPELLKKALKRKQKMKDKKKQKWEKRTEHVEKIKDDKQKKRTENIQKRKQNSKDKKMQKLKKKGRIIPGF